MFLESYSLMKGIKELDFANMYVEANGRKTPNAVACAATFGCKLELTDKTNLRVFQSHPLSNSLTSLQFQLKASWHSLRKPNPILFLPSLPHLTSLTIDANDHDLSFLVNFKFLTSLTIDMSSSSSKRGFRQLSSLQQLQRLNINLFNGLDAENAQHLSSLQQLHTLIVGSYNKLGSEGARHLSSLKQLKTLIIGNDNKLGPEGARHLSSLQHLNVLSIGDDNKLGPEGARHLSSLRHLNILSIGSNKLGPEGARHLLSLQYLTKLVIGRKNNLCFETIDMDLPPLRNLAHLEIGDENCLGVQGARYLSSISSLSVLVIGENNKIGAEGARALSCLENLTSLRIKSGNDLGGMEGVLHFCNLKRLKNLYVEEFGKNLWDICLVLEALSVVLPQCIAIIL